MDFDKLSGKLAKAATKAGDFAKETANTAKIKFALANLQGDLDEMYEELGRLHYNALISGSPMTKKEDAVVEKIAQIKADIDVLKAEIEMGKATKAENICPECGSKTTKKQSFCPYCGTKL